MTYLSFLALFLGLPLAGALALVAQAARRGQPVSRRERWAVLAHLALAVVYTTPWDNFLVATRVWTYAPARVLGVTLGWVPLEEYGFFVLQSLLTALLVLLAARRWPAGARAGAPLWLKRAGALLLAGGWLWALGVLAAGWQPGTYLGLELVWALPPLAAQLALGADGLWRRKRAVAAALLPVTLYLCAADRLAIGAGVWRIDPAQSLNWFVGGLPVEEAVFFLLTNALVVFGVTLACGVLLETTGTRISRMARIKIDI